MTYFVQQGDQLLEMKDDWIVKIHHIPATNKGFKNMLRDVVGLKTQQIK